MNKERTYFQDLVKLSQDNGTFGTRTVQALTWFKTRVRQVFGIKDTDPEVFFDKRNYPNVPIPGNIVTFRYSPAGKSTLPYYDMFPLVLIVKLIPGGFIGINFHHLHPSDRAEFMSRLQKYQRTYSDGTIRINIKYDTLKLSNRLIYHKVCLRRYHKANIKTMFYTLTPNEWDIALFLPTERFVKTRKQKIWEQSQEKLALLKNGKRK
jgi:hypothetical protein